MSDTIKTKRCPKCKRILPLSEFHKNRARYDGLVVYCKYCTKQYRQSEKSKQAQKRYRQTEKNKQYQKQYFQTDKGKHAVNRYNQTEKCKQRYKRYHKNNPEKMKARRKLSSAIRAGKLLPAHHYWCACGKQAEEYHHWSYEPEHQLDVIPMCAKCHNINH